ncbi:beta-defensin 43 [Rhinolophus sinicus]|uniref:beta-defensin 43 n=1 Tax=Rhinolophus sinicus TaxID=89399 RepID=UPI0009429A66|nr:PREDICTED: beta-defensin 43-like [Rhinolophus sinicus]
MRVLLCILGGLALLSIVPSARSTFFYKRCSSRYYSCRMKCNLDEYAIRYCDDWSICCRVKKIGYNKKKKVIEN